jgi:hypothetical protein
MRSSGGHEQAERNQRLSHVSYAQAREEPMVIRVALTSVLLTATVLAGEDFDREHQLRQVQLRYELAVEILEHAEEAVQEHRAAFEGGRITQEQFHEVLLARDEAKAERDRLALDLEEVRATGREPRPEVMAPLVGGKDLVKARLAIGLELARRRLQMAERRASEAKRLLEVQAGAPDEVLHAVSEVEAARAEHTALESLLKIRRAFLAGELPEAAAERQAAVAEVTAELEQARIRNRLASARARELRALFDVGRVTKAELREAVIEAARTRTELELVRLELERWRRETAPRGGTELDVRVKAGADERARVLDIVAKRLSAYGFKDVTLGPVGEDRFSVLVAAPGREKLDRIKALVTAPGELEFRVTVEPGASAHHAHYWSLFEAARNKGVHETIASFISPDDVPRDERARFPDGLRWYRVADEDGYSKERWAKDARGTPQPWVLCALDGYNLTGEHLLNVFHAREPGGLGSGWAVYFKVEEAAQERMAKLTSYAEDKYLAIIVDGKVHSAPLLRSALTDSGQITGGYTEETARTLAAVLKAGALKHPPELVSERTVTADQADEADEEDEAEK